MTTDAVRGVPWRDPVSHRTFVYSPDGSARDIHERDLLAMSADEYARHHELTSSPIPEPGAGFGAESSPDWFECPPDTEVFVGLARGIRWSDVMADIEQYREARHA